MYVIWDDNISLFGRLKDSQGAPLCHITVSYFAKQKVTPLLKHAGQPLMARHSSPISLEEQKIFQMNNLDSYLMIIVAYSCLRLCHSSEEAQEQCSVLVCLHCGCQTDDL
jgi:hypothetical protein